MVKLKFSGKTMRIGPKCMTIKVNTFYCKKCNVVLTFSADVKGVKCPKCNKDMVMI